MAFVEDPERDSRIITYYATRFSTLLKSCETWIGFYQWIRTFVHFQIRSLHHTQGVARLGPKWDWVSAVEQKEHLKLMSCWLYSLLMLEDAKILKICLSSSWWWLSKSKLALVNLPEIMGTENRFRMLGYWLRHELVVYINTNAISNRGVICWVIWMDSPI